MALAAGVASVTLTGPVHATAVEDPGSSVPVCGRGIVPDVLGMSQEDALLALQTAGFADVEVRLLKGGLADDPSQLRVEAQNPKPGYASRCTKVIIYLYY
ncbi:PASTA domain-containing protein [Micromonospora sp. KC213]|uniref:PASTA domain-containing protein n=1 Tax=Micromonospora sp. KC213 TaxID=2530378 RepID=UPI001404398E|nr:PASTA domain-containing protein [Micromonospora sp. KC213]